MRKKGGFTLVELLIVVTIISILAGMVLGGITAARGKVRDSKTKSQLNNVRVAAENYLTTFGDYTNSASCSAGMFIAQDFGMALLTDLDNYPAGTTLRCTANGASYAIVANLTWSEKYWCVDPAGGKELETDPGEVTACP